MDANKIHAKLTQRLEDRKLIVSAAPTPLPPVPIIVKYANEVERDVIAGLVSKVERDLPLISSLACLATEAEISTLSDRAAVVRVSLDYERIRAVRAGSLLDEAIPLLGAQKVWAEGVDGTGVIVAVLDTELDPKHPDLRPAKMVNVTGDDTHGTQEHGTHVSGILTGNGSASNDRYRGVAPGATLYHYQVLGSEGWGMMSWIIDGLGRAVKDGVHVVNMSLGSDDPSDGTTPICEAVDAAVKAGVIVCVAAGNDGAGPIGDPAAARLAIVVGATDKSDRVASFSSHGKTLDGRHAPGHYAPGVAIMAALAFDPKKRYGVFSGTSMATPMLAGVIALIMAGRKKHGLSRLSRDAIAQLLFETGKGVTVDDGFAAVRIDAYAAYQRAIGTAPVPEPEPIPTPEPPWWEKLRGCLGEIMDQSG